MLYQLSYLGILGRPKSRCERAVYREVGRSCPPAFALRLRRGMPEFAFGFAGRGPASDHPQIFGETGLFGVFRVGVAARDDVFAG